MAFMTIELLPRLGCANIVVTGLADDPSPKSVNVSSSLVEVEGISFPLPATIRVLPQSASSFSSSSAITFRVKLADSSEVGNTCLLPLPLLVLPRNLGSPQINAKIGQEIIISCRCGNILSNCLTLVRVLPLPSHNWDSGASEWYCCSGRQKKTPELRPQGGDLFYSPYSIVISSHQLASPPSSTSSLLLCSGCNKELGEVEEERESATLWADAILISSPSLETHSVPPIQGISTSEDLFMAMVNLMVSQSPELMPKVVVKSRSISGLLLWVVDKNLRLLKGSQDKVAEEQTVLKILFKELTMEDGHSSSVMVPKEVVESGYKLLEDSTRHFPGSMRSAQGFSIGHISKG